MSVPSPSEALLAAARADLLLRVPDTDHLDPVLFEHACRVERYAAHIAVWTRRSGQARFDDSVLSAAALYHCAAWAVRYRDGHVARSEILSKSLSDVHLELSASRAAESLAGILDSGDVETVCQIIRECGRRDTSYVPAQIVSEAANLDQIGPLALWQMIRRYQEEGRGVEDLLQTWDRQREYNFWHARIKDAFRIPAVRRVAQARLEQLDRFMAALRAHRDAEDLSGALAPAEGGKRAARAGRRRDQPSGRADGRS